MGDGRKRDGVKLPGVRPLLHLYWRFSRGMTLGVRAAVFDADERVFLIRHTYAHGWHLPGGGVEPGETALRAMERELEEEARIALAGEPRLHGVFYNDAVSARDHVLVFEVRDFRILEEKRPDSEIAEAGFFPVDALPADVTAGTRRRLIELAQGVPPSPIW